MNLVEIPAQIAKTFKYSQRSWKSFLFSFITAVVGITVAVDLIYGFFYARLFNVEKINYGPLYWWLLLLLSLGIPLCGALLARRRLRRNMQPFETDKFGIAIAPFEVFSFSPGTLSDSQKINALEDVSGQFFKSIRLINQDEPWAARFEFRFLPEFVRIDSKQDARATLEKLGATALIWGKVSQEENTSHLVFRLIDDEQELNYNVGSLDERFVGELLRFWFLFAASRRLVKSGETVTARQFLSLAMASARRISGDDTQKLGVFIGLINAVLPAQSAASDPQAPPS